RARLRVEHPGRAERLAELPDPVGMLVQQEAEVGGGPQRGGDREQHARPLFRRPDSACHRLSGPRPAAGGTGYGGRRARPVTAGTDLLTAGRGSPRRDVAEHPGRRRKALSATGPRVPAAAAPRARRRRSARCGGPPTAAANTTAYSPVLREPTPAAARPPSGRQRHPPRAARTPARPER